MSGFDVDTTGLLVMGGLVSRQGAALTQARVGVMQIRGAAGAAGEPRVDAALDSFVSGWGVTVAALQEAAAGLGNGARLAAFAYELTDRTAIGG